MNSFDLTMLLENQKKCHEVIAGDVVSWWPQASSTLVLLGAVPGKATGICNDLTEARHFEI